MFVYIHIYILLMQRIVNRAYSIMILGFMIIHWKNWQNLKCHDNSHSLTLLSQRPCSFSYLVTCKAFWLWAVIVLFLWHSDCFSFSWHKILYTDNIRKRGFLLAHCLGKDTVHYVVAGACDNWPHCLHSQEAERGIWVIHTLFCPWL